MKPSRAALGLALCGVLAACSAHASAGARGAVPASQYLVCQSLAGLCTGVTPKYEPAELLMSGDGTLYATGLTWSGWGAATATGHGTAEANNCQPDCAKGTLSAHPVTIVLSRPVRWHMDMVYSRASFSIPSLHDDQTWSAGLIPRPALSARVPAPGQSA
ncbi:MAG TPA: hypothetical protein VMA72_30790 [Streptosporangiaceae bacterium]|nr:hypothetical protein [Streptosporangiaceae bacterium]